MTPEEYDYYKSYLNLSDDQIALIAGQTGGPQTTATPSASPGASLMNIAAQYGINKGVAAIAPSTAASTVASSSTGAFPVASAINGGTIMSDGTVAAAPGALSMSGIGAAGNAILPLAGLAGAYDIFSNKRHGLSGGLEGAASGAAMGSYFGPIGIGVGAVAGGLLGAFANHKTTKEYEAERWADAAKMPGVDKATLQQMYLANHPAGDDSIYKTGPHAGQKWDFATANEDAKSNGSFNGALGNVQTFGADWSKYTPKQQVLISEALAQQGLYKGDHGDILISDPGRAKDLASQVIAGTYKPTVADNPNWGKENGVKVQTLPQKITGPNGATLPDGVEAAQDAINNMLANAQKQSQAQEKKNTLLGIAKNYVNGGATQNKPSTSFNAGFGSLFRNRYA